MKNQVLKINRIVLLTFVLCALSFTANAQKIKSVKKRKPYRVTGTTNPFKGCERVLAEKSGIVYSLAPGQLKTVARSRQVTVEVKKTGGRAKTIVNVYADGNLRKTIVFENGNYSKTESRILSDVKYKKIKIEIVNQSVGNTFKYTAKIIGKSYYLFPKNVMYKRGVVGGQGSKTITLKKSCTGKTKITIQRTEGKALAAISIYYKPGMPDKKDVVIPGHDGFKRELIINSNKEIRIVIANSSVLDRFGYSITAEAIL